MSHHFTAEELRLIQHAISSYQHNHAFQPVIEKVNDLLAFSLRSNTKVTKLTKIKHG